MGTKTAKKKRKRKATKKQKQMVAIYVVLYLICILVMDYNFLARAYNDTASSSLAKDDYPIDTLQDGMKDGVQLAKEAAEDYNDKLARSIYPSLANPTSLKQVPYGLYESLLDLRGDGSMGTVTIPVIGVSLHIYHGTGEDVLQKGAGHIQGTSVPVGGESTHSGISAHTGLPDKTMFNNLTQMQVGDKFFISALDETLEYEAIDIRECLPEDTSGLAIEKGRDLCTLVTCTPYGVNSHRLLVTGERVMPMVAEDLEGTGQKASVTLVKYWWLIATAVLLLMMLGTIQVYLKKGQKKKGKPAQKQGKSKAGSPGEKKKAGGEGKKAQKSPQKTVGKKKAAIKNASEKKKKEGA